MKKLTSGLNQTARGGRYLWLWDCLQRQERFSSCIEESCPTKTEVQNNYTHTPTQHSYTHTHTPTQHSYTHTHPRNTLTHATPYTHPHNTHTRNTHTHTHATCTLTQPLTMLRYLYTVQKGPVTATANRILSTTTQL